MKKKIKKKKKIKLADQNTTIPDHISRIVVISVVEGVGLW